MMFSHIARVLFVMALATAGGCENTPTRSGLPWWPQGPGNPPGSESAAKQSAPSTEQTSKPATQAAQPLRQASATTASVSTATSASESQATRYGDLLFLSGQVAASGDIAQQTHAVMEKVGGILESHRLTMANVVHVTVQLASMKDLQAMDAAYTSHFPSSLPARTVAEVAHLPGDALVQITVVAGR